MTTKMTRAELLRAQFQRRTTTRLALAKDAAWAINPLNPNNPPVKWGIKQC